MIRLDRSVGRKVFGGDPAAYDAARPEYPDWVYETLRDRCALGPGTAAFEVGPGTGIATRRLVAMGATVTGLEPDPRLAAWLRQTAGLNVRVETLEDTQLPSAAFMLGLAATSFHWVEAQAGLAQVARLLKPGGWWAMVWNEFGDPDRRDDFHEATFDLLQESRSPSAGAPGGPPYGQDHLRRSADLEAANAFTDIEHATTSWTLTLDPAQVRALYGTYSEINARALDDRERLLDAIAAIAERQFSSRVERNMLTTLYTARRRA